MGLVFSLLVKLGIWFFRIRVGARVLFINDHVLLKCLSFTEAFLNTATSRGSRPEVFCKKGVLKNFAKFVEKHLCQSLVFNKVVSLRSATLFKKRLWHRCFPVNYAKCSRTAFFIEHLWWLLLYKPFSFEKLVGSVRVTWARWERKQDTK